MMSQVRHSERRSAVSDCLGALCYLQYYTNLSCFFVGMQFQRTRYRFKEAGILFCLRHRCSNKEKGRC